MDVHSPRKKLIATLLIISLVGLLWVVSLASRNTTRTTLVLARGSAAATGLAPITSSDIVMAEVPLASDGAGQTARAYGFTLAGEASALAAKEPLLVDVKGLTPVTALSAAAKLNTVAHTVNWGRAIAMATEYPLDNGSILVLLLDEGAYAICSAYEVRGRDARRVFNASYMQSAGASPSLRILPGLGARQAPEMLELSLPFGLAEWRWNGHDFALSPIAVSHIPVVIPMALHSYGVWLWLALAGLFQWALVIRHAMRATTALAVGLCLSLAVAGLGSMPYRTMPLALGAIVLSGLIVCMVWPKLLQRTLACFHELTIWRAAIMLFLIVLTFLGVALITASMETTGWITGTALAAGMP
ncbi:MAG: hypothetical protein ABFD94_20355 [Armatimonadia bacterium]